MDVYAKRAQIGSFGSMGVIENSRNYRNFLYNTGG